MNIKIKTIPHNLQSYDTCGDWVLDKEKNLHIYVSNMKNEDYEFLVAIHEFIEAYLCKKAKITQKMVDEFDFNYEGKGEPGDCKEAPYYFQHRFATEIEKLIAKKLKVSWKEYDKKIKSL